jgi:hypothetical protein
VGGSPTAPSITLVDGRFKVWSHTSNAEILTWRSYSERVSYTAGGPRKER